jgi:uncharacterized protein YegL
MNKEFQEQLRNDEPAWRQFNQIDMKTFINETATDVNLIECMIDNINCTDLWTQEDTYLGTCLQLDIRTVKKEKKNRDDLKKLINGSKLKEICKSRNFS